MTLYRHLQTITDFRTKKGRRFELADFLEMVVLAGMSGYFGINNISRFIKNSEVFFIERYGLLHGVPSKTSVFNILSKFDYTSINQVIVNWIEEQVDYDNKMWVAIDGKSLRSTLINGRGLKAKQNYRCIVSSYMTCQKLTVHTNYFSKEKNEEAKCARKLIEAFEDKGVIFTLDALHCKKKRLKPSWIQEMTM